MRPLKLFFLVERQDVYMREKLNRVKNKLRTGRQEAGDMNSVMLQNARLL